MTFDAYERGALNLDEYLNRVVFHRPRTFTREAFTAFMFSQSQAHEDMIALVRRLKEAHGLRVAAVSNEGRELMLYRIRLFGLSAFVDAFIGHRKPELTIYRMALDVMQVPPEAIVYLDDREMFVQLARELGIRSIYHESYAATRAELASLGLRLSLAREHPHSGSR
jgi:putative hydrolase of the HAD superfamily